MNIFARSPGRPPLFLRQVYRPHPFPTRASSQSTSSIDSILASPSWSVRSLLPLLKTTNVTTPSPITPKQLQHLLRLSALPPPPTPIAEAAMLDTLAAQLHFVAAMRAVDTTGVVPLQAIRDETAEGEAEAEVSLDDVEGVLGREEQVGAFGRKRRRRGVATEGKMGEGEWDPLSLAERKVGRYFVVESGHGGTS